MSRRFTFLGTGTSVGVPMLGCACAVCRSNNPKNQRYRCAALVEIDGTNFLIDTPPELRLQLLRAGNANIHACLITHYHADHIHGLDDLRPVPKIIGGPVPIWCSGDTERRIRESFSYAFSPASNQMTSGFIPKLTFDRLKPGPNEILDEKIIAIPLEHAHFDVFGFRFGNVAYCTDVNKIPRSSMEMLEGLDVLILDALRHDPHPAHFNLGQALEVIEKLEPRQAYLTHISHDFDHEVINAKLPGNVRLAYDGLSFAF